jgi:uncharacterized protein YcgI (DUF1989 family)
MEYLSLPHTRASSYKLVPEVDDTLLTNLRNPIITFVEDTTPGAHDTLTAACDANLYAALGVDKPAEHGSCAENLVLALKELNENAGLKGAKAVGADISVNIAPTPLHLFMVTPVSLSSDTKATESGAKGAKLAVEEPKGKKRGFVRFRAERDVVVVFSACPMDVGPQNGGRCMAANFMVEDAEADDNASVKSAKSGKRTPPKKLKVAVKKDAAEEKTKENGKSEDDESEEKSEDKVESEEKGEEKGKEKGEEKGKEKGEEKGKEKGEEKVEDKGKSEEKSEEKTKDVDQDIDQDQDQEKGDGKSPEKSAEEPADNTQESIDEPAATEQKDGPKAEEPEVAETGGTQSTPDLVEEKKSNESVDSKPEEKADDKSSDRSSDAPSTASAAPKKKPKKLEVRKKQ